MTPSIDQQLATLLATPERPVDEVFITRTAALVAFDQRRRIARRAALSRVALEAAAAGAMLIAFAGAARIGAASGVVAWSSPAMAGLVALALWCAVSLRAPGPRYADG